MIGELLISLLVFFPELCVNVSIHCDYQYQIFSQIVESLEGGPTILTRRKCMLLSSAREVNLNHTSPCLRNSLEWSSAGLINVPKSFQLRLNHSSINSLTLSISIERV